MTQTMDQNRNFIPPYTAHTKAKVNITHIYEPVDLPNQTIKIT